MGNNKAKKRKQQRLAAKLAKIAKIASDQGPPPENVESETLKSRTAVAVGTTKSIIVDVGPEDDDDFVRTLVHVQKTQLCLNSRTSSRTTRNSTAAAATAVTGNEPKFNSTISKQTRENVSKIVPMKVQVPSVEYIFQKYGKYIVVRDKPDSADNSPIPEMEAGHTPEEVKDHLGQTENETNDTSLVDNQLTKDEQSAIGGSTLTSEQIATTPRSHVKSPKRSKKRKSPKRRKGSKGPSRAIIASNPSDDTTTPDLVAVEPEAEKPESDPVAVVAPALPKKVTLKKDLINQMIGRLLKSKTSSTAANEQQKKTEETQPEVVEIPVTKPSIPIVTIDLECEDQLGTNETSTGLIPVVPDRQLIVKEEIDLEDDVIVPRIETISGATSLQDIVAPPPPESDHDIDIAMSSDDPDSADDVDADPDFDPDDDNSTTIRRTNSTNLSKKRQSDLTRTNGNSGSTKDKPSWTTCETCGLKFLSATNFKIHMREYHNEYGSVEDDEDLNPPSGPVVQYCEECQLPFGNKVGLNLHMRVKHPKKQQKTNSGRSSLILDVEPKETNTSDAAEVPVQDDAAQVPVQDDTAQVPLQQHPVRERVLYVCSFPDCDRQFSSIQNMKIHKRVEHEFKLQRSISCILCKAVARNPRVLYKHFKEVHADQIDHEGFAEFGRLGYADDESGQTTPSRSEKVVHAEITTYKCVECNISFMWKSTLDAHTAALHKNGGGTTREERRTIHPQHRKIYEKYLKEVVDEVANDSPILAAHLESHSTTVEEEAEQDVINVSDSDENVEDTGGHAMVNGRLQAPDTSTSGKEPIDKTTKPSSSKSAITVCPFCFKTVLFKNFSTHVEVHAKKESNSKKFSCPFTGCTAAQNTFRELVAHHKKVHQEKQPTADAEKLKKPASDETESNSGSADASSVPSPLASASSSATSASSLAASSSATSASSLAASFGNIGFMCSLCNIKFRDMTTLLVHCQLLHTNKVPRVKRIESEDRRVLRSQTIQPLPKIAIVGSAGTPVHLLPNPPPLKPVTVTPIATVGAEQSTYALIPMDEDPLSLGPTSTADIDATDHHRPGSTSDIRVTPLATIDQAHSADSARLPIPTTPIILNCGIQKMETESGIQVLPVIIAPASDPKLQCPVCQTTGFEDRRQLNQHVKSHNWDREPTAERYSCDLCPTSFVTQEELNSHCVVYHKMLSQNLPATCPVCKVTIKQARNLPRHVTSVHQMQMCTMCPQLFKQQDQYALHFQLHTRIGPTPGSHAQRYQCLECLQVFESITGINLHYNAAHNNGDKCTCVTCNIQLQRKNLRLHLQLHQRCDPGTGNQLSSISVSQPFAATNGGSLLFSNTPLTNSMSSGEDAGDDEILSDPLAEPGDTSGAAIFHQQTSFQSTQFEFEDVTIGEESGGTVFGEMTY